MYQFAFLSSIFRICVHFFLAPSEPFNNKEKSQFLWKDFYFFYLCLYGIICKGNTVAVILVL